MVNIVQLTKKKNTKNVQKIQFLQVFQIRLASQSPEIPPKKSHGISCITLANWFRSMISPYLTQELLTIALVQYQNLKKGTRILNNN
jgi:hypothetical protein